MDLPSVDLHCTIDGVLKNHWHVLTQVFLLMQAHIVVNNTMLSLCPCLVAFPTPCAYLRPSLPVFDDPKPHNRAAVSHHTCPQAGASHAFNACSFHRWTVPIITAGLRWLLPAAEPSFIQQNHTARATFPF